MIRGTTAQFKFRLPYNIADVSVISITFWQTGNDGPDKYRPLPIVKTLEQCSQSTEPNELFVVLNKEETLRFSDALKAYVQLQGETIDGFAFASQQEMVNVYPVKDDSTSDGDIVPTPTPDPDGIVILDGASIDEWKVDEDV